MINFYSLDLLLVVLFCITPLECQEKKGSYFFKGLIYFHMIDFIISLLL